MCFTLEMSAIFVAETLVLTADSKPKMQPLLDRSRVLWGRESGDLKEAGTRLGSKTRAAGWSGSTTPFETNFSVFS